MQGRNALSWEHRLALDVWYVDHWSLGLDLKILLLTVVKVLRRENISPEGHATMPRFDDPTERTSPEVAAGAAHPGSVPALHAPGWRIKAVRERAKGAG